MLLGDEFDASTMCTLSPTPIYVHSVKPKGAGNRCFELHFFHANYPAGVQDKLYTLQTIERGRNGMLVKSTDHDPSRFLYLTAVTIAWLRHHFPNLDFYSDLPENVLNRAFGKPVSSGGITRAEA
jgi:hypothetical protein